MKVYLKAPVMMLTLLLLSACANKVLTERTENQAYQGQSIHDLMSDIGKPQDERVEYNGDREYVWSFTQGLKQSDNQLESVIKPSLNKVKLDSFQQCQFSVLTNRNNVIRSINFELDSPSFDPKYSSMCIEVLEKGIPILANAY
ncbi:hypothetical protein [uncultured Shewanella sp.]|uniref:hypothetical protein n=1 Tax=uncultured Shewanella sp. TaxID=173975 RepID=UPI00261E99DA|nr:hypothetical protein [uncultured Shewanella sp.]